jgi:hypothetical protein
MVRKVHRNITLALVLPKTAKLVQGLAKKWGRLFYKRVFGEEAGFEYYCIHFLVNAQ